MVKRSGAYRPRPARGPTGPAGAEALPAQWGDRAVVGGTGKRLPQLGMHLPLNELVSGRLSVIVHTARVIDEHCRLGHFRLPLSCAAIRPPSSNVRVH
jgi:hypothetical protein